MINFKQIGTIVFIGLIILNMITYKSCVNQKNKAKDANDMYSELVSKYDSVLSLPPDTVELPAEIIKEDTIIYETKWRDRPSGGDIQPQIYKDSIINDSIDLRLEIAANELYDITYDYRPIYKYQEKIVNKNIPYPVEVVKEVKVNTSGLFFNAGLGYAEDNVAGKLGLMYLSKKNNTYSYDFVKYGNKNMHFVSYGIKF